MFRQERSYSMYGLEYLFVVRHFKITCLYNWSQITLHSVPTEAGMEPIYNQRPPSGGWNSNLLLTHFSHANWSDVCLTHLFTSDPFSDGRLGVAYIASPADGLTGGICSQGQFVCLSLDHPLLFCCPVLAVLCWWGPVTCMCVCMYSALKSLENGLLAKSFIIAWSSVCREYFIPIVILIVTTTVLSIVRKVYKQLKRVHTKRSSLFLWKFPNLSPSCIVTFAFLLYS